MFIGFLQVKKYKGGEMMEDLVMYLYSNGDLYLMIARIFVFLFLLLGLSCILASIRGLRI